MDREPGVVLRMVHLYHRARLGSVGVALAIGTKPPHVRTTLFRVAKEWEAVKHRGNTLPEVRCCVGRVPQDLTD